MHFDLARGGRIGSLLLIIRDPERACSVEPPPDVGDRQTVRHFEGELRLPPEFDVKR